MDIHRIDKTVINERLREDIEYLCHIVRPSWKNEVISYKKLSGGLVNDIYHCTVANGNTDDSLITRIYTSQVVCDMVNRDREVYGMQIAHAAGVAEPLYIIFNNGLVYGFATGSMARWGIFWDDQVARNLMQCLAKLHHTDFANVKLLDQQGNQVQVRPKLRLFENLRNAINGVPEEFKNFPERKERLRKTGWSKKLLLEAVNDIEQHMTQFNFPVVFSHNDCWLLNVVHDIDKGQLRLIDYEFADYNFEGFDIAVYFSGFQVFEKLHESLPAAVCPTQEELKLPRTDDLNRKLARFYMEEKCLVQGKKHNDFTEEEFERFYMQAQMIEKFTKLYFGVFHMTQLDDPNVHWDIMEYVEMALDNFHSERGKLFSFIP